MATIAKNTPAIAIQWRSMCGIIYFRPALATGLLNTVLILADPLPAISTGMHRPRIHHIFLKRPDRP